MVLSQDTVIECEGLVRRFDKKTAVDHLDLDVKRGEIFGFLGPNGAGKTTTVRMLTTMDLPNEGRIVIDGFDTKTNYIEARRRIGVIQQHHSLEKDISVRENIMHHALMQNMSFKQAKERMKELCDIMELTDRMDDLIATLSGGWKKRVAIVCSLIHDPEILFMDEPTTGLDTQSRNLLWKMIRSINARGTTIFLTTHYIFEAENLCNHVAVIASGKKIAEGTPRELIDSIGSVALAVTDPEGNETIRYFHDREEAKAASAEVHHDCDIAIRPSTLEDVFLELTGRKF